MITTVSIPRALMLRLKEFALSAKERGDVPEDDNCRCFVVDRALEVAFRKLESDHGQPRSWKELPGVDEALATNRITLTLPRPTKLRLERLSLRMERIDAEQGQHPRRRQFWEALEFALTEYEKAGCPKIADESSQPQHPVASESAGRETVA